jgi:cytidine deaminase
MRPIPLAELPETLRALAKAALDARAHAYSPYSGFAVGAAVRAMGGRVYAGCNVENASFGLTVCAERVALWNALAAGESAFEALAVASETGAMPCGACRQVMAEFAPDMPVAVLDTSGHARLTSVSELLPFSFTGEQLH